MLDDEADGQIIQDEGPLQKVGDFGVGPILEIEEANSDSDSN